MKILLHIGHFKTGSTAFQKVLSNNRTALAAEGVYYPLGSTRFTDQQGYLLRRATHHSDFVPITEAIETGRREGFHTIVLSGEVAANASPERAKDLLDHLRRYGDVEVIYVIRHWRSYLPSRYIQNIRRGDGWAWPDFFNACKTDFETFSDLNFRLVIDAYSSADQIHLEAYGQDICERLLALLGLAHLSSQIELQNTSNFSEGSEVQRLINCIVSERFKIPENQHYLRLKSRILGGDQQEVSRYRQELNRDKNLLVQLHNEVLKRPIIDIFRGYDFSSWEKTLSNYNVKLDPAESTDFQPSFASIDQIC